MLLILTKAKRKMINKREKAFLKFYSRLLEPEFFLKQMWRTTAVFTYFYKIQ